MVGVIVGVMEEMGAYCRSQHSRIIILWCGAKVVWLARAKAEICPVSGSRDPAPRTHNVSGIWKNVRVIVKKVLDNSIRTNSSYAATGVNSVPTIYPLEIAVRIDIMTYSGAVARVKYLVLGHRILCDILSGGRLVQSMTQDFFHKVPGFFWCHCLVGALHYTAWHGCRLAIHTLQSVCIKRL